MKVFETFTTNELCNDAHVYDETWLGVFNTLTNPFLTKKVLREAYDSRTEPPNGRKKSSWSSRTYALRLQDSVVPLL